MHRLAILTVVLALGAGSLSSARAQSYKADPVHSTVYFKIKHANASYFQGRFNDPTGSFTLNDADPSKSSVEIQLSVDKVDTGNEKRDGHLKGPDFFNAKQFPTITFKSTGVKKTDAGWELAGDLTIRGVTRSVSAKFAPTGKGEFPKGVQRAGIEASFSIKRSDFDVKALPEALGDEVMLNVCIEGVQQ